MPLDLLAEYLAGAQMRMMTRWLERRLEISPLTLAQVLQRLQRAALREALGIMYQGGSVCWVAHFQDY